MFSMIDDDDESQYDQMRRLDNNKIEMTYDDNVCVIIS